MNTSCCCAVLRSLNSGWLDKLYKSVYCLLSSLQLVDVESDGALSDGRGREQYHFAMTGKSLAVILEHFPDLVPKVSNEPLFAFTFAFLKGETTSWSEKASLCPSCLSRLLVFLYILFPYKALNLSVV